MQNTLLVLMLLIGSVANPMAAPQQASSWPPPQPLYPLMGWPGPLTPELQGIYDALQGDSAAAVRGVTDPCPKASTPYSLNASSLPLGIQVALQKADGVVRKALQVAQAQSMSFGFVYGEELIHHIGVGQISKENTKPPTADSVYRVGSISKVFTDLQLLMLEEAGSLPPKGLDARLTDLVANCEPHAAAWNPQNAAGPSTPGITLRQLGSHMAGLPRETPCPFFHCNITLQEACAYLANATTLFPPGAGVSYSNAGFAYLARALETVTGEKWEQWIDSRVFQALGMTHSSTAFPDSAHLAAAYRRNGAPYDQVDLGFERPAGQIYASARDLGALASAILGPTIDPATQTQDPSKYPSLLSRERIEQWRRTVEYYSAGSPYPGPGQFFLREWALPWQRMDANVPSATNFTAFSMLTKDGLMPGYAAQLVLVPELKLGLAAYMAYGPGQTQQASAAFIDAVMVTVGSLLVPAFQHSLADIGPFNPLPRSFDPQDYVGTYVSEANAAGVDMGAGDDARRPASSLITYQDVRNGGMIRVTTTTLWGSGGHRTALRFDNGGSSGHTLLWQHGNVFTPVIDGQPCATYQFGVAYALQFLTGPQGSVDAVMIQGNGNGPVGSPVFRRQTQA